MKHLIWFWNLVYYKFYKMTVAMMCAIDYIDPITWISKSQTVKQYYVKKGVANISTVPFIKSSQNLSLSYARINIAGLLMLIEYGIFNFVQIIAGRNYFQYLSSALPILVFSILVLITIPAIFNNFTLDKNNNYSNYFKEFERVPVRDKAKNNLLVVGFGLMVFLFVFLSFVFLPQ